MLLTSVSFSQEYEQVSDVPDPKKNGGGYVSNPDGILSDQSEVEINMILSKIETSDTFQVALVCLNSIGNNVPKDFATDLFNEWGLGYANKDNGLLVLFVLDQRRIEFETGDGTEAVLSDVQCTDIIDEYMISYFKAGDYDQGLLRGMNAVANHLSGKIVDSYQDNSAIQNPNYYNQNYTPFYQKTGFWMGIAGWQLLFIIPFLIALIFIRNQIDPYKKYGIIRYFHLGIYFLLFPIAYLLLFKLIGALRQRYRDMIRFSGKTGGVMHKLSDQEEDEFLTSGQLTEELVRSVDYDVWLEDTKTDIVVLPYRPLFTKYTKCPKCNYKTYYKEYDRQLVAPTTYSNGTGERKHSCQHCKHVVVRQYSIPKIVKTSTNTMRGWSSGGGSSSGGWSGGGGSWGGGRSSGGGGGRSW